MTLKLESLADKLRKHFESMTEEEIQKEINEFFPKSTTPKGWVSIEDELPKMMAMDIMQGATKYKVLYNNGKVGYTYVADHLCWYYGAKDEGITHWWND
jgi:hypothetical protein